MMVVMMVMMMMMGMMVMGVAGFTYHLFYQSDHHHLSTAHEGEGTSLDALASLDIALVKEWVLLKVSKLKFWAWGISTYIYIRQNI